MVDQGCNAAHQHSSEAEQRLGKADESSRLQSFRRDLTRLSFFLASNLFRLIAPALALPTSTVTTTASSINAAPSATSSAGADRGSTFQIFSDGTQDIAALVGIFATDSVEKYAIDYSKGYLATAVANLSLLGLLGFVRLLVKLGLGADGCRKAGFDMKALRPMFGVQDEEYVPTDAVHKVFYMRRNKTEGQVHWSIVKIIKHTEESFQLLKVDPEMKPKDLEIASVWLDSPTHVFLLPLLSILCSALTCFPIMIFERPQTHHQSWTYYYATVGLFCSIVISTSTWMWVHIQEQHPRRLSEWTIAHLSNLMGTLLPNKSERAIYSDCNQLLSKTSSLDLKDTFAFSQAGKGFRIYDVSAAERKFRFALKVSSFLLSGSILVGYACQYIEVRRLSAIKSGYWLLIQGALAAIRVSVWVWDPSWDDLHTEVTRGYQPETRLWNYDLMETRLVVLWASLHTESPAWLPYTFQSNSMPRWALPAIATFQSNSPMSAHLSIPRWALPAIAPRNQNPKQMFELARKLKRDNTEWDQSLQVLQNAEDFWDMPPGLFMAWVFAWPISDSPWSDGTRNSFSCRIIKDKQHENGVQRFHFLPCWDEEDVSPSLERAGNLSWQTIHVFGVHSDRNRCVFALNEDPDSNTNSGGPLQHKFVVGCDTPISVHDSRTPAEMLEEPRVEKIFETMDLMWKTLDPVLEAVPIRPRTPSNSTSPIESYSSTNSVRTSQQASPIGSAIELTTLPSADEGTHPNADQTPPQRQSSTSNDQNTPNAPSP